MSPGWSGCHPSSLRVRVLEVGLSMETKWASHSKWPAASAGTGTFRPDLTTIPLHGVDPSHVVLVTRADDRSRLVAAFRKCAQAHLTGPGLADR